MSRKVFVIWPNESTQNLHCCLTIKGYENLEECSYSQRKKVHFNGGPSIVKVESSSSGKQLGKLSVSIANCTTEHDNRGLFVFPSCLFEEVQQTNGVAPRHSGQPQHPIPVEYLYFTVSGNPLQLPDRYTPPRWYQGHNSLVLRGKQAILGRTGVYEDNFLSGLLWWAVLSTWCGILLRLLCKLFLALFAVLDLLLSDEVWWDGLL